MEGDKVLKFKSWVDFVDSKASKENKFSALRNNIPLLISNPGPFRSILWKSLIPSEWISTKEIQYSFLSTKEMNEIVFHLISF